MTVLLQIVFTFMLVAFGTAPVLGLTVPGWNRMRFPRWLIGEVIVVQWAMIAALLLWTWRL
jgi:hypothetical protein